MFKISTEGHVDRISLSTIEGVNHSILWDRAGEVRLMPWAVIRNARDMLESWNYALDAGIIDYIESKYQEIAWDSCLGLPAPSSAVRVKQCPV